MRKLRGAVWRKWCKTVSAVSLGMGALVGAAQAQLSSLNEGFNNISALSAGGWVLANQSAPLGTTGWFQGSAAEVFAAHDGAPASYIAANYQNTGPTGTISNWLLTPHLQFGVGATLTFWTRKPRGATDYPDRLEVRLSSAGASIDTGSGATGVGDFSTLALSINPTLAVGGYPYVWTQYTVSGLPINGTGRLAFRYHVTGAGTNGANSDYIGLDRVVYTTGAPAFTLGGSLAGLTGGTLVLRNNGGDELSLSGNGPFSFATPLANGAAYHVTVQTQPTGQTCTVANGSGSVAGANVGNVGVSCAPNRYAIATSATPPAGGSVTCTPNPVTHGASASCAASASPGHVFGSWGGACSGTDPVCALANVQGPLSVSAQFRAVQTLSFPPQTPATHTFSAGGSFAIDPLASSATPHSGNPIVYSSLTPAVCSVSGTSVTMVGVGTCTLAANQAGDAGHTDAAQVTQDVAIDGLKSFSGTTVPGNPALAGAATASFSGGGATCGFDPGQTGFIAAPAAPPPGQTLPQGMFRFRLTGCDATPVTMTVQWPRAVEGYLKYGRPSASAAGPDYFAPEGLSVSGQSVSFTVQDGQRGDDDWTVNGVIVDPTGPTASAAVPTAVPTLGHWSLMLLGLVAAAFGARRLRRAA